ncbi:TIGR02642 family protein [Serratia marcescens]|uniref:TIGR02642 family protein n=1 Tax=Serratia marcescens TaxID=615 RepID=UPI00053426D9|nr:TIGR02642 family protein [Serratia marcescens]
MTNAIEQLIKMHDPRCVSAESMNIGRGRASLTREQILGAFAAAQHQHSVGLDLLLTKYRNDYKAEQRLRAAINEWVHQRPHPERATAACQLALSIVLERNLPAQMAHFSSLFRRYGPRAARTRKNIEALQSEIKALEKRRNQAQITDIEYHEVGFEITDITKRIERERAALRAWTEQHAATTNTCPRCSGSGRMVRPHPIECEECGGKGKIPANMEHLRKSMRIIGATVKSGDLASQYSDLVKQCMDWLYVEETNVTTHLNDRINQERG